jgi:hypothetical protein
MARPAVSISPTLVVASYRRCTGITPTITSRVRSMATTTMSSMNSQASSREGDISDAFAAFGGKEPEPLHDRYRSLKLQLVDGYADSIVAGWERLLKVLQRENQIVAQRGVSVIPELQFSNLDADISRHREEIKRRGVAVIRGVIPEDEARSYKFEIEDYVRRNPQTRGEFSTCSFFDILLLWICWLSNTSGLPLKTSQSSAFCDY